MWLGLPVPCLNLVQMALHHWWQLAQKWASKHGKNIVCGEAQLAERLGVACGHRAVPIGLMLFHLLWWWRGRGHLQWLLLPCTMYLVAGGVVAPAVVVPVAAEPAAKGSVGRLPEDWAVHSRDAVLAECLVCQGLVTTVQGLSVLVEVLTPPTQPQLPSLPCPRKRLCVVESDEEEEDERHSFLGFASVTTEDLAGAPSAAG